MASMLDAEGRHGEGVHHVGGRHLDAHDLVDRHDHLVVDREQPRLAGLRSFASTMFESNLKPPPWSAGYS